MPRRENYKIHAGVLTTRETILEAAREVAHTHGCATQLKDIIEFSGYHKQTMYDHFGKRAHTEILRLLGQRIVDETSDMAFDLVQRVHKNEDGRSIFQEWAYYGFQQVHVYGEFAVQLCYPERGRTPEWLAEVTRWEDMLRFTGFLVKHCQNQGHCRKEMSTRSAVRVFYTLCGPQHVRWAQREGLTLEELQAESLDHFFRIFAAEGTYPPNR